MQVLTKEVIKLWLYFKMASQDGFVGGRRHQVQKDWKFERILLSEPRQIDTKGLSQGSGNESENGRVKNKKQGRVTW